MLTVPPVPVHGSVGSTQAQKLWSTPNSGSRKWNAPHTVAPGHTPPPHCASSLEQGVAPSGKHAQEEPMPAYSRHEKPGSHAPSHAGAPLPPVQRMRGIVVVVVVVVVVLVVVAVGIAATAFSTRSSTKRSMPAASPVVRHGGRASAFAKTATKRASAFGRHAGSTVTPRPVAFAWQRSLVFAFLPVALSLAAAQRLLVEAGRSADTRDPTLESSKTSMSSASSVVTHPPRASAWSKASESLLSAFARHAGSVPTPCLAAVAWHARRAPAAFPVAFSLAPAQTWPGVRAAWPTPERTSSGNATAKAASTSRMWSPSSPDEDVAGGVADDRSPPLRSQRISGQTPSRSAAGCRNPPPRGPAGVESLRDR